MKRILLFLSVLTLAGVALAQVADLPAWDWSMLTRLWENPIYMTVAIVGLVNAIRKSQAWLDGPILVPVFSAALGAVLGAVGQFQSMLTVVPFAEWSFPIGGLLYGASCALSGTIGLNVVEYVARLFNRSKTDPVATTLALVATGQSPNAGAWIMQTAKGMVPSNRVSAALELLAPLIARHADSVLTDELRAELQTRIHKTLRDAKLLKGRDFGAGESA